MNDSPPEEFYPSGPRAGKENPGGYREPLSWQFRPATDPRRIRILRAKDPYDI